MKASSLLAQLVLMSSLGYFAISSAQAVAPLDQIQESEWAAALTKVDSLISGSSEGLPVIAGMQAANADSSANDGALGRGMGSAVVDSAEEYQIELQRFRMDRPVHLMTEKRPGKLRAGDSRKANIYYYDYSDDSLLHYIVDLSSNDVIHESRLKGVQLPLTQPEIDKAFDLVMTNDRAKAQLSKSFRMITGYDLASRDQVNYKSFVFHSSTMSADSLTDETLLCGQTRCAQLLIYTKDNVALDFSPIVSISQQSVTQLLSIAQSDMTTHQRFKLSNQAVQN